MGWDFLRKAEWLGKDRARGYLLLLALINGATLAFLLLTAKNGIDRNGFLVGSDFISFWTSGRMLTEGANVYDTAGHAASQREFYALEASIPPSSTRPTFFPLSGRWGCCPIFPR